MNKVNVKFKKITMILQKIYHCRKFNVLNTLNHTLLYSTSFKVENKAAENKMALP